MSQPPSSSSRFSALSLSPRAAVVLAAVVVVVAVVVVAVGARSGTSGGVGGAAVSVTGGASDGAAPTPPPTGSVAPSASTGVVVHVVGAVRRPGIMTLAPGSRVAAAVERAGGATDDADLARLNLARVAVDGERLYVPRTGETDVPAAIDEAPPVTGGTGTTPAATDALVDLNTADQAALETLPGIGPSLAGRILAWRDEHGRFGSVEDLLDVNGIGDGRFADLRDRVRV